MAFTQCDAVISPVTPTPAFKLGEKCDDPLQMYLTDIYTVSANLAGIPGISVPCGTSGTGLAHRRPVHGAQMARRHTASAWVCDTGDEPVRLHIVSTILTKYPTLRRGLSGALRPMIFAA